MPLHSQECNHKGEYLNLGEKGPYASVGHTLIAAKVAHMLNSEIIGTGLPQHSPGSSQYDPTGK